MIVFKRGTKLPPKYLTSVLQERHEQAVKNQQERWAKRDAKAAPHSDAEPCDKCGHLVEEEPLGPHEADERLDGLRVTYLSLPLSDVRGYRLDLMALASDVKGDDGELSYEKLKASERAASLIKREAVTKMVASIDGLANEDGSDLPMPAGKEFSEDELTILEDNAIIDDLFTAGLHLQDLTDEARKNCGASQRSISADSTATPAQPLSDQAEDATDGTETTSPGRSISAATSSATTPPAYAPNASSSETQTSAPLSSSPGISVMQA